MCGDTKHVLAGSLIWHLVVFLDPSCCFTVRRELPNQTCVTGLTGTFPPHSSVGYLTMHCLICYYPLGTLLGHFPDFPRMHNYRHGKAVWKHGLCILKIAAERIQLNCVCCNRVSWAHHRLVTKPWLFTVQATLGSGRTRKSFQEACSISSHPFSFSLTHGFSI